MDAVIFGLGKQGRRWAQKFQQLGVTITTIIDPAPRHGAFAKDHDIPVQKPANVNQVDADVACIATPTAHHEYAVRLAAESDVPTILCEKPLTPSAATSDALQQEVKANGSDLFVNYVERHQPVYKQAVSYINENNIQPTEQFHWRGKEPRNLHPYTKNDLCHDVSELLGTHTTTDLANMHIKSASHYATWADTTDRFPDNEYRDTYDVASTTHLQANDRTEITLTGGFNEPIEHRYFVWTDRPAETAVFVSTLPRDHATPTTLVINGAANIAHLHRRAYHGDIHDDEDIASLERECDAKRLQADGDAMLNIAQAVINGGDEWTTTGAESVAIERLLEEIYRGHGVRVPS